MRWPLTPAIWGYGWIVAALAVAVATIGKVPVYLALVPFAVVIGWAQFASL